MMSIKELIREPGYSINFDILNYSPATYQGKASMKKGRTAEEQKIVRRVEKNGQQHLLLFWDELTEYEKDILIKDIQKIDFELFKIFLNVPDQF